MCVCECQHASVILRQSSVHIKRNTSPPVTTQLYQFVCEGDGDKGRGGEVVCVRNANVCLHHMLNLSLYLHVCVCVCGEEQGRGADSLSRS